MMSSLVRQPDDRAIELFTHSDCTRQGKAALPSILDEGGAVAA
jgi:hypothetical protein